jgi:GNAT superfamily N-acetyltransferase
MDFSARPASLPQIAPMRELYRQEMNCQIIHDSLHSRKGWTLSYELLIGNDVAGYGSIAIAGPWKDKPTVFEFFILPQHRSRVFDLFSTLLAATQPVMIETQSNNPTLTVMLHTFAKNVASESILYHDKLTTTLPSSGAILRPTHPYDAAQIAEQHLDAGADYVLEISGAIAATGGILYHYNRPYGDIYMSVAENFRRRGLGSYLVQELKRICYEGGSVPAARCNVDNIPSRKTLQKAGFVPCGNLLTGGL